MYTYYLSLGTNLGDKEGNLRQALQLIEERIGAIASLSAFYVSEPWGFQSDNSFLNACCAVNTILSPLAMLDATQQIECDLGRTEKSQDGIYHDRLIDIDLLLAFHKGEPLTVQHPRLFIPHPLMHQRQFVLIPLRQIAPFLPLFQSEGAL